MFRLACLWFCTLMVTTVLSAIAAEPNSSLATNDEAIRGSSPPYPSDGATPDELGAVEDDPNVISDPRFFPALYAKRRFGPVEEPEQEFYTVRDPNVPGYEWNPPSFGWGNGWGFGGWGYRGYGYAGYGRYGLAGYGGFPRFSFGFVGYNRYAYRPWYASPSRNVWSNRYPWYSPGGAGPNIYQPWYYTRATLPWYSPYGIGPNIYTPSYTWQSYYPWYSPYGVGPNIYTAPEELGGCFYW